MDFFTDYVTARQATPDLMVANVTDDFDLYCISAYSCRCIQLSGTRRLNTSRRVGFPVQLLQRRWFKQATWGSTHWQKSCDYASSTFPPVHLALPGNKPSLTRKLLERVSKSQLFSLLSMLTASDNEAWKAFVAKNVREGSHGTTTGKISYPFFLIHLEARLPHSVSHSYICVLISLCHPQCCWHLGSTSFSLTAKGTVSLGRLLCACCFQHYIMDFLNGLCYQCNYSHFRKDITAVESLPVFSDISHVNYTFSSGIHLSIYVSAFTLLSRTTLLKTYFKAHFKSVD